MRVVSGILLAGLLSVTAFGQSFLREVSQPIAKAYIANGFDTDDNVEIVVMAILRDSCMQVGRAAADVDEARRLLTIHLTAYEFSGNCVKADIPVYVPLYVGPIRNPGIYTIQDNSLRRAIASFGVSRAPITGAGVDSVSYPPLTDAYLLKQEGKDVLVLKGFMPLDCLTIDAVDVQIYSDSAVVRPRMSRLEGVSCRKGNFPFTKNVPVTQALPRGVFLLHVRSMGGRSINKMVAGT